jgi:stage V sporulation protein S
MGGGPVDLQYAPQLLGEPMVPPGNQAPGHQAPGSVLDSGGVGIGIHSSYDHAASQDSGNNNGGGNVGDDGDLGDLNINRNRGDRHQPQHHQRHNNNGGDRRHSRNDNRRSSGGRGRNSGRRGNNNNNSSNNSGGSSGNRGQPAVFISAEGSPRTYAATIAEHVRGGQPPVLMAAGANSINQATKSLAYARQYLASDGLDLSAQPEYRQREDGGLNRSTTALSFQCIVLQLPKVNSDMDVELKVSKRSDPNTIAGAIAGKCREHLRVGIQSIGPVCTVRAVSAIAIARRYLVNDGQDLRFRPEFISCEFEEGSCMGLRLSILQMQV